MPSIFLDDGVVCAFVPDSAHARIQPRRLGLRQARPGHPQTWLLLLGFIFWGSIKPTGSHNLYRRPLDHAPIAILLRFRCLMRLSPTLTRTTRTYLAISAQGQLRRGKKGRVPQSAVPGGDIDFQAQPVCAAESWLSPHCSSFHVRSAGCW